MKIADFLKEFKVGYTFISTMNMPFRYGENTGEVYNFKEYTFTKKITSVCIEQSNLLSCIMYGNAIMESIYIPENNYGNLDKIIRNISDKPLSEIQVPEIFTGRIVELTPELLKEIILNASNKVIGHLLNPCFIDYMEKYKNLNTTAQNVYEYYTTIKDKLENCNANFSAFKEQIKNDHIIPTDFLNKDKAIKLAKEKYTLK